MTNTNEQTAMGEHIRLRNEDGIAGASGNASFGADIRSLGAAEVEEVSGALGPLLIAMGIGTVLGVVAAVATAPSRGGGSGITWQQILDTAQGRPRT